MKNVLPTPPQPVMKTDRLARRSSITAACSRDRAVHRLPELKQPPQPSKHARFRPGPIRPWCGCRPARHAPSAAASVSSRHDRKTPAADSIRQPGEVWRRVDDLGGHLTPEVVHSSPDLPRPDQTIRTTHASTGPTCWRSVHICCTNALRPTLTYSFLATTIRGV